MDAEALGAQPLYFRHLCLHLPLFFHHKQGLLHLYDQGKASLHPGKSNLHFMILNYAGVEYKIKGKVLRQNTIQKILPFLTVTSWRFSITPSIFPAP